MSDPIKVTLDVEQLRRNFSAAEGRERTADDVMEWLRECGFRYQGRTWLCEEVSLGALARSEYRIVNQHQAGTTVLWTIVAVACLIASVPLLRPVPALGLGLAVAAMLVLLVSRIPVPRRRV